MFFVKDKDEDEFFASLVKLPDRVAGILATTIIDDRLTEASQAYWHDVKTRSGEMLFDRLFRYDGPLGSFGTRIDIGYAMGLYSGDILKELHTVRRVRNLFAHKLAPKDFQAQMIIDLTKNLTTPERFPITAKDYVSYRIPADGSVMPTLLELVKAFLTHSHVSDMTDSRSRFIRAAEILSGLLFAISSELNRMKRQPQI